MDSFNQWETYYGVRGKCIYDDKEDLRWGTVLVARAKRREIIFLFTKANESS